MAKLKKVYFCTDCGYETPKWLGKCPACGAWNTIAEHTVAKESSSPARVVSVPRAEACKVQDIAENQTRRIDTGNKELNRVLGGGIVPGSLILLGGEPGIGKSTLSLQLALTDNNLRTLYVSGEESAEQIKMRAKRLGINNMECTVFTETLLENIIAEIESLRPDMVIIDSIQTMSTDLVESSAGSVTQIRECTAALLKVAKMLGISIFIIGHITKEAWREALRQTTIGQTLQGGINPAKAQCLFHHINIWQTCSRTGRTFAAIHGYPTFLVRSGMLSDHLLEEYL